MTVPCGAVQTVARQQTGHGFDKGGFPGTVQPDQPDNFMLPLNPAKGQRVRGDRRCTRRLNGSGKEVPCCSISALPPIIFLFLPDANRRRYRNTHRRGTTYSMSKWDVQGDEADKSCRRQKRCRGSGENKSDAYQTTSHISVCH